MGKLSERQRHLDQEIRKLRRDIEAMAKLHDVDFDKIFMNRASAARVIGITPRTLDRWNCQGYIKRTVVGGRIFYSKREILRIAQLYTNGIGELADSYEFMPFQPYSQELDSHLRIAIPQ